MMHKMSSLVNIYGFRSPNLNKVRSMWKTGKERKRVTLVNLFNTNIDKELINALPMTWRRPAGNQTDAFLLSWQWCSVL